MYISKDENEIVTIHRNDFEKKINPYKDLRNLLKGNILKFKIDKVLPMWDKMCIIGEIINGNKPERRTLVYDNDYKFCKLEDQSIAEIFGVDVKKNAFSDLIFLAKNFFYFFSHGHYYSCNL